MRRALLCLVLGGCGGHAPNHAAAAEIPVTGTATIAGTWLTNDDLDWFYRLVVVPDGRFALAVDRGKLGQCDQKGKLAPGKTPATFVLSLTKDSCSPPGSPLGGALGVSIQSYTGESMTLVYAAGATSIHRVYQRDPKVPH